MASNIKGITIEIGGNTGPLQQSLKDVNKTSRDLQSELRQVNSQLKFDPNNTVLLQQKQKLLSESIGNTKDKLITLKEAEKQVQKQFENGKIGEEQYRALQREVIKTEVQLKGLEKQAAGCNSTLAKISETTSKVGAVAGNISNKMTPATIAIAGTGVALSKMSIDYEDSVAKASTISDESEVSIGDLSKSILKLSDDTGIASTEIAGNVYDAISAGQKTGDAVNFVSNSTKLAKAGFAEAGQSLDLLTTIMNSYELESNEVNRVSDVLINTQNKGKVTVGQLSECMGKVVPTAKAFGVNLEQVSTGYAIMTAKGIKAAESTTYMNSMFNEMGKSGTKASDTIKAVSGKSFQDLIASGKSVGDVLALMKEHADKNNLSLADMFGSAEAGKAALILSNNAGEDFNNMLKDMNNVAGATDKAFEKVSNTTGEKFKKSINELKNDTIKLGDLITPIVEKISSLASKLAKKISSLSKGQLDMVVNIALVIAAIAPLAKIIQGITIITGGLSTVIGTVTGAIKLYTGAATTGTVASKVLAAAISFLTGPVGIVIMIITALVGAFIYFWNTSEEFRKFWINLWEQIKSITSNVVNAIIKFFTETIPNAWNSMKNFIAGIPGFIKGIFNSIKVKIENILTSINTFIFNAWNSIKVKIENILTGISKFILNSWNTIKETFINSLNFIVNFIKDRFGGIIQAINTIFEGIKTYFLGWWGVLKNIFLGAILLLIDLVTGNFTKLKEDAMHILDNLNESVDMIWEGIKLIFKGAIDFILAYVRLAWDGLVNISIIIWTGIKNFFVGLWASIVEVTTLAWDGLINISISAWNGIKNFFIGLWASIVESATLAWNEFKTTIVNICSNISTLVVLIWNGILDFFINLPSTLYNLGVNMFTGLRDGISSILSTLGSVITNGFQSAINFITNLPSQAYTWGVHFIEGLINGIKDMMGKVQDAVVGVAEKIRSFLHFTVPDEGPLTDYETWMPDFMEGLAKGINNSKYLVQNAVKGLSSDISVGVNTNLNSIKKDAINTGNENTKIQPININMNSYLDGEKVAKVTAQYNDKIGGNNVKLMERGLIV
ncbi:phage tail tape measure protein [Clostridium septicum]|uniref:phage tail tape measure protein n=1 Tax=Clostridium septicum TaxID=1504 RepID=UPI0009F550A6|nr:phage tail tape measure protein [Clostridium septicum]